MQRRTPVRGTQRRGDERRNRLMRAAYSLLGKLELIEVTYAAVCAEARIPPSSAHHFYPDLDAVYRALLDAHRAGLDEALMRPLRTRDRRSWQAVVECFVDRAIRYHRAHPVDAKLAIGGQTPPHLKRVDQDADRAMARMFLAVLQELFIVPRFPDQEVVAYLATQMVDVAFTASMCESGRITPAYAKYAKTAAIGFLAQYLGEKLEPRPAGSPPR